MKTSFQIKVDKIFGSFLNLCLYIPVRIFGKILRINHSLSQPFSRIVVAKYKGMGSIIQASSLLNNLRLAYPKAKIIFVTTENNTSILKYYTSEINDVYAVNDKSLLKTITSTCSLIVKLLKFKPQVYIDLEIYSHYGTLISTLSAAKNRLGYYKSDKDYRTGLYTHLMYYNIKAPLSEIYLQTARMLGAEVNNNQLIKLEKQPAAFDSLRTKYPDLNKEDHSYFIINPNASDLRLERRWPRDYFINLIQEIQNTFKNQHIYLIGNKAEEQYVNSIYENTNQQNIICTAGKLKLNELIELMRNANLVITNDTGPLHLSLALKLKVVGLFGPCSPSQYGQMETCIAIYNDVYCSPCVHEFIQPPCGGDNQCMKLISVHKVIQAVNKHLTEDYYNKLKPISYQANKTLGYIQNRKE